MIRLLVMLTLLTASAAAEAKAPNVIVILADDLGVETIHAYGGEYSTPNIDGLARQGVTFQNAHATPLCSPTRTRLMTGIENAKNYQAFGFLDPKTRTIGNIMKDAGYATSMVGKWQLSGNGFDGRVGITPKQAGFDESLLWAEGNTPTHGSRYWGPMLSLNGKAKQYEWGFGPDLMNDFVMDFIERNKDHPFFLYYTMVLPHPPLVPTPVALDVADGKPRFAAMISYMDLLVGKLMEKLKALGLDEDTIVVFAGDNGTPRRMVTLRNGKPVRGGKGAATDAGTHVPMIMRWTGHFPAAASRDGLFDVMDLLPTLTDLAGHPLPPGSVDGVSQRKVIEGSQASARSSIFMHYAPVWIFEPARFVFDTQYKLYGDGRFVEIDHATMTEKELKSVKPRSAAAKRRAEFERVLGSAHDGPLDQNRFPPCIGKTSVDPKRPATEAGCEGIDVSD